jgi:hypothetical protein
LFSKFSEIFKDMTMTSGVERGNLKPARLADHQYSRVLQTKNAEKFCFLPTFRSRKFLGDTSPSMAYHTWW